MTQPTVTLLAALIGVSGALAGLVVERYALALTSGMREGELLGIKWEDMNWRPERSRYAVPFDD